MSSLLQNFVAVLGYFLFIFYIVRTSANGQVYLLDRIVCVINSGALASEARSGAPWVKKGGKLTIRENLVIT